MFLIFDLPSTTIVWHLSIDKSAFVGTVGSRIIHQVNQDESQNHALVIDIQTSGWAMAPAVIYEEAPAFLSQGQGTPEKQCLRQSPMDKTALWKPRFPKEMFQCTTRTKQYEFGHTGEGKRSNFTTHINPLPRCHSLGTRELSWP